MEPARISVARVLALGVAHTWQDAVAVAAAAAVVTDTQSLLSDEPTLVSPETCFLTTDGQVELPHSDPTASPLGVLALLRDLIEGCDAPAEVQQLAASHDSRSITVLITGFPVPNPAAAIGALARAAIARDAAAVRLPSADMLTRRRPRGGATADAVARMPAPEESPAPLAAPPLDVPAAAAAARQAAPLRLVVPTPAEVPEPHVDLAALRRRVVEAAREAARSRQRWLVPAAGVAAVIASVVILGGLLRSAPRSEPALSAHPLPAGIVAFVPAVPPSPPGVDAAGLPGRTLRVVPADAAVEAPSIEDAEAALADASPPPADLPSVRGVADSAAADAPPQVAVAPLPPSPPEGGPNRPGAGDDRVFTAADLDVTPPLLRSRQLQGGAHQPGAAVPEGWPYLVVIVDGSGQVEQVRLYQRPTRPGDPTLRHSMLVAAAKAWQFEPAQRNGQPVRYAIRVPLEP